MQHIVGRAFTSRYIYYMYTNNSMCEHVARCQLHYCMQCIVLAAEDLDKRALYNAPSIYTRYSFADM